MEKALAIVRSLIPRRIFLFFRPAYHMGLAGFGALWYRFPSRSLYVVGVTGTKGKTSTTEFVASILRASGARVALMNTNRIAVGDESKPNRHRQSMPGRTVLQRFFRKAVGAGCRYAVIEMTSEGARLYRHAFIKLDALIFTNLSPEHIESHGSYENYVAAKLSLAHALEKGDATMHTIVANADDPEGEKFLAVDVGIKVPYRLSEVEPYRADASSGSFTWHGREVHLKLPGLFNVSNALAAAAFAQNRGFGDEAIVTGLETVETIAGRMEKIDEGQDFTVIVDYAHTADSLERAMSVFSGTPMIGILGGTGGGRDKAKRSVMGAVADTYCEHIILTTEDPFDESPRMIADDTAAGITKHSHEFIEDRREAIRQAFARARPGSVVFIGGKGAMPYIMGPKGLVTPWSDADVAREELKKRKPTATT